VWQDAPASAGSEASTCAHWAKQPTPASIPSNTGWGSASPPTRTRFPTSAAEGVRQTSTSRAVLTPRHICVHGLTAAGKTTHAVLLAQQLQIDYVSASQLMFAEMGYVDPGDHDTWIVRSAQVAEWRESGTVDRNVNIRLLQRVENPEPAIFDSWALPYMAAESPLIRSNVFFLHLESDLNSRAVRCLVSQGARPAGSVSEAARLIKGKDSSSRDQFQRLFGDKALGSKESPRAPSKARLDVSDFVFGSSPRQVCRGIRAAHDEIVKLIPPTLQTQPNGREE
jgi:cytidylate kinase